MNKSQKPSSEKTLDRRAFFRTATVSAVGGAAIVAIGDNDGEAAPNSAEANDDRSRYRETNHVRMAYKLARF